MKKLLFFFCLGLATTVFSLIGQDPLVSAGVAASFSDLSQDQVASVFFVPTMSVTDLQEKYKVASLVSDDASTTDEASTTDAVTTSGVSVSADGVPPKIKILVMPGHEPGYGGAEYRNLKERDMTVELADDIAALLRSDPRFEAIVPRTATKWNPPFDTYFSDPKSWSSIKAFATVQRALMSHYVQRGVIKKQIGEAYHNTAPDDVGFRIYGINKWSNENGVDLAIHIHFNDYPRSHVDQPGEYSGFAIYVPDHQYSNSSTTKSIAYSIDHRLAKYFATSSLPQEAGGVVEDQGLIAVGSNNSVDAPSMLIEYAYMYQPELQMSSSRSAIMKDMAYQTYLGLVDFFENRTAVEPTYDSTFLPYTWKNATPTRADIVALQTVLMYEGLYPPRDKQGSNKNGAETPAAINSETLATCPRSGIFGDCTIRALTQYQKNHGITGEDRTIGKKTRAALNATYGLQSM